MVGIILAAGDGNRFNESLGRASCKALREINNKHLIEFALDNLVELSIDKVYIVVGKQECLIKKSIGDEYKGIKISYVFQKQQKGLINALMQGVNAIGDHCGLLLQLADEILVGLKTCHIRKAIAETEKDFYCGITYEDNPEKIKNNFSVEVEDTLAIKNCTEKPTVIINNIKGTGFCIFNEACISLLKEAYNEEANTPGDLCDYMNYLVSKGKNGTALVVAEKEFNINTIDDLQEATDFLNRN